MNADDPRHGKYAGAIAHWFDGERPCDDCARAEWRYRKTRQLRALQGKPATVSAIGVLRRIQALHALGWTGPVIAKEAGISVHTMRSIGYHEVDRVRTDTAQKIAAVYDRLSMIRPEGKYANRARSIAARRGWLPPLAFDDIDDPNEQPTIGRDPKLYRADDLAAEWDFLRRAGVSIHAAAQQLGVSVSAIEKALERVGRSVA